MVGVNLYADGAAVPPPPFKPDPGIEDDRIAFLAQWRTERDAEPVRQGLAGLERAARGSDNLVPHVLECLKVKATLGEVCDTLRAVFGVHQPGQAS